MSVGCLWWNSAILELYVVKVLFCQWWWETYRLWACQRSFFFCCWCGYKHMQVLEKACIACSTVIIQSFLVCTKLCFHWIVLPITWQIIDSLFEVELVVSMCCAIIILTVITTFTTHGLWGRKCALWWIISAMFNFLRDLREYIPVIGCVFRRMALYGFDPPREKEHTGCCGRQQNSWWHRGSRAHCPGESRGVVDECCHDVESFQSSVWMVGSVGLGRPIFIYLFQDIW